MKKLLYFLHYFSFCVPQKSYGFGTAWGWVNNDSKNCSCLKWELCHGSLTEVSKNEYSELSRSQKEHAHIGKYKSVFNQIIHSKKNPRDTCVHLHCLKCSPVEVHLIQKSLLYHYWFRFVVKKENPRKWCLASRSLIDPEFKAVALYLLCFGKDSFENPRGIFVFLHVFCLWLLEKAAVSAK